MSLLSRMSPSGSCSLVLFNRREGPTKAEAKVRANRTEHTIRIWRPDHDNGFLINADFAVVENLSSPD
ncbi:hypothetical protein ASF32_03665 [Methylobacterium sp. Leaf91]|nr:hypothetical protein ASF32_03665 [Methylobacterium sp. Leaf91]